MKIYIITFNFTYNCGAALQAYALYRYIKALGIDVALVDYRPKSMKDRLYMFRQLKKCKTLKQVAKRIALGPFECMRYLKFKKFYTDHIRFTTRCNNIRDIINLEQPDIFICGSDQIWNEDITGGFDDGYFLNFNTSARKVSYAASIGKDILSEEEIKKLSELIKDYKMISVRERCLKQWLQEKNGREIYHVLDPVFLLEKEAYLEIEKAPKFDNYILIYAVSDPTKCVTVAKKIAQNHKLKIIQLGRPYNKYRVDIVVASTSPQEFIGWINRAAYVVTNSFHATAFSIILEKQFYVIPPEAVGSRIWSLLEQLSLQHYAITNIEDAVLRQHIDYTKVKTALLESKEYSTEFLKHAIRNIEA